MTNLIHVETAFPAASLDRPAQGRKRISYLHHPDFDRPEVVHEILESLTESGDQQSRLSSDDYRLPDRSALTPDVERQLFLRMNLLRCLAARRLESATVDSIDNCERIVANLLADADRIRNEILETNQRLIVSNAALFMGSGIPLADLVSEANVAMITAIERFDISRGFRLSTYATYAIRRHLSRLVKRDLKRRPNCPATGVNPDISDGPGEWLDDHPSELASDVLKCLPPREREMVRLRFGLNAQGRTHTLREIGSRFNISKERVRQLISRSCEEAFQRYSERVGHD